MEWLDENYGKIIGYGKTGYGSNMRLKHQIPFKLLQHCRNASVFLTNDKPKK